LKKVTEKVLDDNKLKILEDDISLSSYDDILEYGIKKYYQNLKNFSDKFGFSSESPAFFVNGAYFEFGKVFF